jgi:hypothetical protein
MHRIGERRAYDWDGGSCSLRRHGRTARGREDYAGAKVHQLLCQRGQSLDVPIGEPGDEVEIVPFGVTEVAHALQKGFDERPGGRLLAQ